MALDENFVHDLLCGPGWIGEEMPFDLLATNADSAVTVSVLLDWITEYGIGGRKSFCDAVGIGESTLSNWIKEDRLPKMAKIVVALYALYKANELGEQRQERRLHDLACGDRLVLDGDSYAIVSFEGSRLDRGSGVLVDGVGRVVARNIESREVGERLLSYQQMKVALEEAHSVIKDLPSTEYFNHVLYSIEKATEKQPVSKTLEELTKEYMPEGADAERLNSLPDEGGGSSNA